MGYPDDRMSVIYNSQESPAPEDSSAPLPLSQTGGEAPHHKIVFVGRLNADKRLDLLLSSLKYVAQDVRVVIAGDGPDMERLEAIASGIDCDVTLLGGVYAQNEVADIYRGASLTVAPGRVGLTAVQSIGYGVPVVCCDAPEGQPAEWDAVIEGVTGGHFRTGDASNLGEVITHWLELVSTDGDSYAVKCRSEFDAKWSPEAHARRIEAAVNDQLRPRNCNE